MLELGRPECLRLLAATSIGRVVVSIPRIGPPPMIRSVNYLVDEFPGPCSQETGHDLAMALELDRPHRAAAASLRCLWTSF